MSIDLKQLSSNSTASESNNKQKLDFRKYLDMEISLFPARFSDKQKESLYLEMSTLLAAGLDIKATLELVESEQSSPKHSILIRSIKEALVGGLSLSESMEKSGQFTPYEYFSVQIGEETGKLSLVLEQLHQYFASRLKQKRQLINALSYPVIIMFTSIGAVAFMLLFIVPMFRDVFKRFGGELPGITRTIISIAEFAQGNGIIVLIFALILAYLFYVNRNKQWFKKTSTSIVRKLPVVGNIVYSLQMARFCTSMALLLGSKVPVLRTLKLVHQMVGYYPIQSTLVVMEDDVLHGNYLHASMAKFEVYNKKMVSLIKIGEEVNKLDVFFEKLARQFSADAEHQTGLLNTFLEPAMIIFLGLVVGFILLAMYMPMFQMSTSIGM